MKGKAYLAVFAVAMLLFAGLAIATPGLTLETDKKRYLAGQDVEISIVNNGPDPIGVSRGYYVATPQGDIVWLVAWAQDMPILQPGESLDYVWDQTYQMSELGDDFAQVAPGRYVIHANYGDSKCIRIRGEKVEYKTVEQGSHSYYGDGSKEYLVIKDDAAWDVFWADHKSGIFPTPPQPDIDFSTEMVIAVIHGSYPNNGAGIAIENVCQLWHRTIVDVSIVHSDGMLPVVTNPYHIVTVPYTDQRIVFHETVTEL